MHELFFSLNESLSYLCDNCGKGRDEINLFWKIQKTTRFWAHFEEGNVCLYGWDEQGARSEHPPSGNSCQREEGKSDWRYSLPQREDERPHQNWLFDNLALYSRLVSVSSAWTNFYDKLFVTNNPTWMDAQLNDILKQILSYVTLKWSTKIVQYLYLECE